MQVDTNRFGSQTGGGGDLRTRQAPDQAQGKGFPVRLGQFLDCGERRGCFRGDVGRGAWVSSIDERRLRRLTPVMIDGTSSGQGADPSAEGRRVDGRRA